MLCHCTLTKGAFAVKKQKKRGPFGPLFLQHSDDLFSLELGLDRESSCLTRQYGDRPYGHCPAIQDRPPSRLRRRLLRLRTELLAKHSMEPRGAMGKRIVIR
jgi:hypothetical protein